MTNPPNSSKQRQFQVSPSAEALSLARNMAFEEIERVSAMAASYARSAGEAAYRGDETTMVVHLKQARLCLIAMIETYKENMGGASERPQHDRADQRSGDGKPRGELE